MKQKYILITRPRAEAETLAAEVTVRGFVPLIEPLLEIVLLDAALPDLQEYAALVFTSANGVRAFAETSQDRALPVFAVGAATADAARQAGFHTVREAGGTAERLNDLLAAQSWPPDAKLLHISGADVARDLSVPGLTVERLALYKAEQAAALSPECLETIDKSELAAALFYSPRTAETFVSLCGRAGRVERVSTIKALCLSDSVVKCLRDLPWQDVQAAKSPDNTGILALLDEL